MTDEDKDSGKNGVAVVPLCGVDQPLYNFRITVREESERSLVGIIHVLIQLNFLEKHR